MKKYVIIVLLLISGCASTHNTTSRNNHTTNVNGKNVYVINYSWHSAVIVNKNDIPDDLIPEKEDFQNARYLEIGWGNKAFYQAKDFEPSLAAKALFIPGPSTLYVYGFTGNPEDEYLDSKVILLKFSPDQFRRIIEAIDKSFDRKGEKRAISTLKGPYGGNFYDAFGSYGILSTCNHWTANVLHSGGLPISTSIYSATAKNVMSQCSKYGEVLEPNNIEPKN